MVETVSFGPPLRQSTMRTVRWTDVQLRSATVAGGRCFSCVNIREWLVCDMIPASMRGAPPCKTKKHELGDARQETPK